MNQARRMVLLAVVLGLCAMSAEAYTVAGVGKRGFADFSKAIVFDTVSNLCPAGAETVTINGGGRACALPMKPVGDGSWACTASVFAGTSYKYYFEYRIPAFEDTGGWKKAGPGGDRSQDNNRVRTITVPSSATEGYVLYNMLGDEDVLGKQGMARQGADWDTELTVQNPDVAQYNGTVDVSSSGNNDTTNMGGANAYTLSVLQTADTTVKISWSFNISAADEIAPNVEGAREFDTTSTYTPYGFKVLRARLPAGWGTTDTSNPNLLKFEDTVVNQVTGDTLYSPNRQGQSLWYNNPVAFTDTSVPANAAVGDSFVYAVIWVDAYNNQSDTKDQNFSGGAVRWTRGAGITVIFLVEYFDPNVVFPNGATEGRIRITPWVNGIPQPAHGFWTTAYMARREQI